ncbi:MAG: UvrD-helicase domain-containing protein [Erysipelotrichaceae bacterium]|nr:UvrD-helicase domain-containing protein [Erysipelotrichaceae bacterium]
MNYESLTRQQLEAVTSDYGYIRVIAGAGSGKTRVLTMRIVWLIKEKEVPPYNIYAITFTNKAANEMKSRIESMLGDDANLLHVSTIHSLCVSILRSEIRLIGFPSNFTIVDADDQRSILKEAYKKHEVTKTDISYASALDYIANCKYEHIDPKRALFLAKGDFISLKKAKVYEYYNDYLNKSYALDFDDLILKTVDIFDQFEEVKQKWAYRCREILVDEFQDIDPYQYKLIRQLGSIHRHVYVVGDPDQTIYTWRGADVNIILNFEHDFPETQTILLSENFRSTQRILGGANDVIKNNKKRIKKDLYTNNPLGSKIVHASFINEEYEADYVKERILDNIQKGYKYGDNAILYRANYLSRSMEKTLASAGIPYVIYGGIRFYERAEIKDTLAYLRMLSIKDNLSFNRTINNPKRKIGSKTLEKINEYAINDGISSYDAAIKYKDEINHAGVNDYIKIIEELTRLKETESLEQLLEDVLDISGYRKMLEANNEVERIENVKELINDINSYQKAYPDSSLDEYLQMVSLYIDKENASISDAVRLMSVHSAKGLEFKNVFIIGMNERVFPSDKSLNEGISGLEEERRLAYVAYTRAMEHLTLTDNQAYSYVVGGLKTTSRFVGEIDEEYLDEVNKKEENKRKSFIFNNEDVIKPTYKAASRFTPGEQVNHDKFGQGIVISESDGKVSIAFAYPHGVKILKADHPSIKKSVN